MTQVKQSEHPILKVKDLSLAYGDYQVLKDVSFDAERGKCLVVMGSSGCGKSTLLKSMVGLLSPQTGKIFFDEINIWEVESRNISSVLRKYGVLFQGGALW